jgi:hypothetical protein
VNKGYVGSGSRLSRLRDEAHPLHHAQLVPNPVLDGLAVPKANDMHVLLSHRTPARWLAHEPTIVGAGHGRAPRYDVSLCDQLLYREAQIGEGHALARHVGCAPS